MENLERGLVYSVEWTDGDIKTNCTFERKHKGFLIFVDENNMKVICRETSIKTIKKLDT
jgi:hypothetical protein